LDPDDALPAARNFARRTREESSESADEPTGVSWRADRRKPASYSFELRDTFVSLLRIEKLTMRFGGLTAVKDLDLVVEPGQIVSIIGPNGAGKTTVFNAVTGIYEPTEGEALFDGKPQRRPIRFRVFVTCFGVGVVAALLGFMLALNVNKLFKAAIKRPYG